MRFAETSRHTRQTPVEVLSRLAARPIAHRGLHDGNVEVPENSLASVRLAVEHDYGIECDVRLSREGTPFVFHDRQLARLCGVEGVFDELWDEEVRALRLAGTQAAPPTLAEFCREVGRAVPLLVELKPQLGTDPARYVASVEQVLSAHTGPAALMSFDREIVEAALPLAPRRPIGATTLGNGETAFAPLYTLCEKGLSFLSHDHKSLPDPACEALCRQYGLTLFAWTVRSKVEAEGLTGKADQITFEAFRP